jgi:glycosyltransferase involved in cell wall biosynthesis
MRSVIEDHVLRRQLSEAGRQRSMSFSWRKCATETMAVYRQVLDSL